MCTMSTNYAKCLQTMHSVHRLDVYAICRVYVTYTYTRIRIPVYMHTRIHVYTYISGLSILCPPPPPREVLQLFFLLQDRPTLRIPPALLSARKERQGAQERRGSRAGPLVGVGPHMSAEIHDRANVCPPPVGALAETQRDMPLASGRRSGSRWESALLQCATQQCLPHSSPALARNLPHPVQGSVGPCSTSLGLP